MASTFDENKKIKCDQSPCQSWFKYIGLEKSNNYSAQYFSARRNVKSSKSDEATDPSTSGQGNGEDTGLEEDKSAEDPDPDLYRFRSDWNELYLVNCDKCDYLYAHLAFVRHEKVRHEQQIKIQEQDKNFYQHTLYEKKLELPFNEEQNRKNTDKNAKKRNANKQNPKSDRIDYSKNNDSEANCPGNQAVKAGPGPGTKRKRKGKNWSKPPKKKKQTVVENCEEFSFENETQNSLEEPSNRLELNHHLKVAVNCVGSPVPMQIEDVFTCGSSSSKMDQSTNSMKKSDSPVVNSTAKDCSNSDKKNCFKQKLAKNNVFQYEDISNSSNIYVSPSKLEKSRIQDDGQNKINCHTAFTLPNDCNSDIKKQNIIPNYLHNGTPPKRFNGGFKKDSAQGNSSVICVGNLKQDNFHNENNAYLVSLGDGSLLTSRKIVGKTKPDVKLKSEKRQKLKTALASEVYEQCLQTIKLEPIKIKKALSSINRVCKARTIEQFRTFSQLKRLMPSGKNSPHQTRVSCSINTGAKSACINSWNKVPFRYQSRKCFFPLSGRRQAKSGLVLSDSPYETLRATFNQNELINDIQFNESNFKSTVVIEELNDEGFDAPERDIQEGQENGSDKTSPPWDPNNQVDSGFMSQYDPENEPQQQMSSKGSSSSISGESDNEFGSDCEDHPDTQDLEPTKQFTFNHPGIILCYQENGRNGININGICNREENKKCNNR